MKGRTPTIAEKALWTRMAGKGCIACRLDGRVNHYVSIHHIDGRTKPGAHKNVLPLCAQHHQHDDTDPFKRIGVHPWTKRFEDKYGMQADLLKKVMELIGQ